MNDTLKAIPATVRLFAVLFAAMTVFAGPLPASAVGLAAERTVTERGDLSPTERNTISIFEKSAPSVAYIFTAQAAGGMFQPETLQPRGTGSGFVWDSQGHVVTNNHVIQGADAVAVKLDTGEAITAKVVGRAPDYDLAVLKLEKIPNDLKALPIGRSKDLKVGQQVLAIGNPFGLDRTLTTGIVSAVDRRLPTLRGREIQGVIQTDAAINPGNSGGPLLDSAGRLIGVNTAILSGSGTSSGVGFAVPVDLVNRIVPQLISTGHVPTPGIGILAAPESLGSQLGIKGVIVARVGEDSAAEKAGLKGLNPDAGKIGDVITAVNGKPVGSVHELSQALFEIGVGKTVTLTVKRNGETRKVNVDLMDIS